MKLAVIGSCITRDVWGLCNVPPPPPLFFRARTSLATLFSPPIPAVSGHALNFASKFQRECVEAELHKTTIADLIAFRPDALILDLIDERFDILEINGAFVAKSAELARSGVLETPAFADAVVHPRLSEATAKLWREGLRRFADTLAQIRPAQTVLHAGVWAQEYVDLDGARKPFPEWMQIVDRNGPYLSAHNALLEGYFAEIEAALPGVVTLRPPPELVVGDKSHRWNLSPFHYRQDYYIAMLARFREIGIG